MSDSEKRITELEEALRDVPAYCENWEWLEKHFDLLKTIPNYKWATHTLQRRFEAEEKANGR